MTAPYLPVSAPLAAGGVSVVSAACGVVGAAANDGAP